MVVITVASKITERKSVRSGSIGHHWPQEIILAVKVGRYPFIVHLDRPNPTSLVSLHHSHISIINNSILLNTSTSTALRHWDTKDLHSLTRHCHRRVRVLVTTKPLVSELVLAGRTRIGAKARVRLLPRHMLYIPPIIMTPLQVLLLTVCYLFLVFGPMFYLILVHHIQTYL